MTHRILIVDDQPDIRKLIRLTLQHLDDAEVHEADNGVDGLRLAQQLKPDLMLLDVMMPGELDGYQVCEKVKKDPLLGPHTKVILITARAQKDDLEAGRKASTDAYLTKAFSPLKLLDLVDDMLEGRVA
jgi:CheY-like chemotaxis protein